MKSKKAEKCFDDRINMIGKKLSPILEEIENTIWEFEAYNGCKPNYTLEGFRASIKIFMSALLDKFFEKQQAEGVNQEDCLKAVEKLGKDLRDLIFNATGVDTQKLYTNENNCQSNAMSVKN